jgi:hypothetical protein
MNGSTELPGVRVQLIALVVPCATMLPGSKEQGRAGPREGEGRLVCGGRGVPASQYARTHCRVGRTTEATIPGTVPDSDIADDGDTEALLRWAGSVR